MEHKYWVQFSMILAGKGGAGVMEVTRELPLCNERDVMEVARAIKKALVMKQGLDERAEIQVVSWCKFEQPTVLVANSLPRTSPDLTA